MCNIFTLLDKWSPIEPFHRANGKTLNQHLKPGEEEIDVCLEHIHTVTWDGRPPLYIALNEDEVALLKKDPNEFRKNKALYRPKCFLWVIDHNSLKIAREKISNVKRSLDPEYICHTNLTNAGRAYIGGELLFSHDDVIYINFYSDRYGGPNTPDDLWDASKKVFNELGYTKLIDFLEL